jgi:ABC-type sugar transport system ATPase subunit
VITALTSALTPEEVVRLMVGRPLHEVYAPAAQKRQQVLLEVCDLQQPPRLHKINLQLYAGEILGLAGLVGSGRTDLARAIFGVDPIAGGELYVEGRRVAIRSPHDAIALGMGFVPEDRKQQGLFLQMSVERNTTIARLGELAPLGFIDVRRSRQAVEQMIHDLDIRTPSPAQLVRNLSGGNQQKVVIARWLARHPKILILDEPTRGIDVGAKVEVHNLMRSLAAQGIGILMISSELPEVLGVSHRILVMRDGCIVAEFNRDQATQASVMAFATGAQAAQPLAQEEGTA